jgi:hypothetical protein
MVSLIGLGGRRHAGLRLGPEILDDDFLDMAMALVQVAQREQCLDALGAGLADADQDAGGERHRGFTGRFDAGETARRQLVGRAEMRAAALPQSLGGALQHDALRHRHRAQPFDVGAAHHARIEMRQQAGFLQYQRGHLGEVGERRVMAEPRQRLARRAVAQFGLVAQREQRLLAAGLGAGLGDRQHLVAVEIGRLAAPRRMGEGAVVADIPA